MYDIAIGHHVLLIWEGSVSEHNMKSLVLNLRVSLLLFIYLFRFLS